MIVLGNHMIIYARDQEQGKYYRLNVSVRWAQSHDNGALISCGLSIPGELSRRSVEALQRRGQATPVDQDTWNHSGCQSSCTLRGDQQCRW